MEFSIETISDRIRDVVSKHLSIDANKLDEKTCLRNLGVDSLDLIEVQFVLEDEFGCKLSMHEFKNEKACNLENISKHILETFDNIKT